MTTRIDLPVRAFIEQRIKENFPDFDFRRSTALNDLTANVFAMLIQPFRNELDNIKIGQSLRYYNLLDDQKIDDILFNLLVFRKAGDKSYGIMRVNFYTLGDYSYQQLVLKTTSGLRFFNSQPIAITTGSLSADEDGTYYADIVYESEGSTSEYSVGVGEIIVVDGEYPEIFKVTNQYSFIQQSRKETNTEIVRRAQDAVITRNLANEYSIRTVLYDEFPFITDISVVGAGNKAMTRDLVPGTAIHTYGKTDVYINTNTVQEDFVEMSFVPDNAKVSLVGASISQALTETLTTGVAIGDMRFVDSNYGYDNVNRSVYGGVLRVYSTQFNNQVFTDYIIKDKDDQGQLIVVSDRLASGSSLIPYGSGFINVDGFTQNLESQFLFKGRNTGTDHSKVLVNGCNFIYPDSELAVLRDVTGITASANSVELPAMNFTDNPITNGQMLVITDGSCAGKYNIIQSSSIPLWGALKTTTAAITGTNSITINKTDYVIGDIIVGQDALNSSRITGEISRSVDSITLSLETDITLTIPEASIVSSVSRPDAAFGQTKVPFGSHFTASVLPGYYSITIGSMEKSVKVGDYVIGLGGNPSYAKITSIVGFSSDRFTVNVDRSFDVEVNSVSVAASLPNNIGELDRAFIVGTPASLSVGTKNISSIENFGSGSNIISAVTLGTSLALIGPGGRVEYDSKLLPIISQPSARTLIIKGNITTTGGVFVSVPSVVSTVSPVRTNAPFLYFASGNYDDSINTITLGGVDTFNFVHPNIVVGANNTYTTSTMYLVNYSTIQEYEINSPALTTYGINALNFKSSSLPTFSLGDQWGIMPAHEGTLSGGSAWGETFAWYTILSTLTLSDYWNGGANTNPNLQLVIGAGPNQGIYNVTEVTNLYQVKIDGTLVDVNKTLVDTTAFKAEYPEGATLLTSENPSFTTISAGRTLKIADGSAAAGSYRIMSANVSGFTIYPGLAGRVTINDSFSIFEDRYQPFFFMQSDSLYGTVTANNFEVWTPYDSVRRMTDSSKNIKNATSIFDGTGQSYSNIFSYIPMLGATISFLTGSDAGQTAHLTTYSANGKEVFLDRTVTPESNIEFEIFQTTQNNTGIAYQILDNLPYYANEKVFTLPVLYIKSVEEVDVTTGEVLSTLTPNVDYKFYCESSDSAKLRYSALEQNLIQFDPKWVGSGMRITYLGDPQIATVNQFVSSNTMKTANSDTLVKRMESTVIDVFCDVQGITSADASELIRQYINVKSSEDPVQSSDIISLLYKSGATYVNTETFNLSGYYLPPTVDGNMWQVVSSRTEILTPAHSTYIPGVIEVTSNLIG